jgi:GNAT superfamily N-acetyltransferase
MTIIKVIDRKTKKDFLRTAKEIYKDDKTWVCPLDKDIDAVFDPSKNTYYGHGEVERWILVDDKNNLTGRIAAFIDTNLSNSYEQPTGGMGFFECINDKPSAFLLFDTAKEWLRSKGMEAMDGPINFGETDKYWGLLLEGFTHPSFDIAYNHPYYQDLFESYGFKTYYKMEGFHFDISKPLPERFLKIAEWVSAKPGYEFHNFTWKDQDKYTKDFAKVFNEAWSSFKVNFEPLEHEYIRGVLRKAKAILDEEFIWFAYFNGEPIGIYLMFPDFNQILKHLNGRLDMFSIIKFVYLKNRKTMTRARGVLMGVIPKFQGLGIESAFILHLRKVFDRRPHYKEIEFSWVADFNPKMRKIFISVGSVPVKNYITYRYLFDRTREFKRYPIPETKE